MYQRTSHLPLPVTRSTLIKQRRLAVEKPSLLVLVFAVLLLAVTPAGVPPAQAIELVTGSDISNCSDGVSYSFAIITDVHVGRGTCSGFPDCGTRNLGYAVDWINNTGIPSHDVRFVVELGDLTEDGTVPQHNAAKILLDGLNIPWVPVVGNHDIIGNADDDAYYIYKPWVESLYDPANPGPFSKPDIVVPDSCPAPFPENITNPTVTRYYLNYSFDYTAEGSSPLHFEALDFVSRKTGGLFVNEAETESGCDNDPADWLHFDLARTNHSTVILSHHAFINNLDMFFETGEVNLLKDILDDYNEDRFDVWFGGHGHKNLENNVHHDGKPLLKSVETAANFQGSGTVRIVKVCQNTSVGQMVSLSPIDSASGSQPVALTFSNVTKAGTTSLNVRNVPSSGLEAPANYSYGSPPRYFDITTTALTSGPIGVEIDYRDLNLLYEGTVVLHEYNGSEWVPVPDQDLFTDLDVVTAEIDTLPSKLALFERTLESIDPFAAGPWAIGVCEEDDSNVQYSFVIVTGFKVGQGFDDYGASGWDDYQERDPLPFDWNDFPIASIVNKLDWIEANWDKTEIDGEFGPFKTNGFRFVAVLGDLTESGELSEMAVAKHLLDTRLSIPWVPVMGNREVWPHTESDQAPGNSGYDEHSYDSLSQQLQVLAAKPEFTNLSVAPAQTTPSSSPSTRHFLNYSFDYIAKGSSPLHFVALDFSDRTTNGPEYATWANLQTDFSSGPYNWFAEHLADNGDTTVVLAHHTPKVGYRVPPSAETALEDLLVANWKFRYFGGWYGGHEGSPSSVSSADRFADPVDDRTAIWLVKTDPDDLRIVSVCMNTSVGRDVDEEVTLSPFAEGSNDQPVTLHFKNVRWVGTTTLEVTSAAPPSSPVPPGFEFGVPLRYFDLETTAMNWEPIRVEVEYGDIDFTYQDAVRLFHWDGAKWLDITNEGEVYPDLGIIVGTIPNRPPEQTLPSTLAVFEHIPSSISGSVVIGGLGVSNLWVELLDTEQIIDETKTVNGTYSFENLREGSYTVRLKEPLGYEVDGDNPVSIELNWDDDASGIFVLHDPGYIDHTIEYRQGYLPTESYDGATDTWIKEGSPPYGYNDHLEADGNPVKKILLKWDLSDLSDRPEDLWVTSALVTYVAHNSTSGPAFQGYRLLEDWGELVTWYTRPAQDSETIGGFTTEGTGYQVMAMNEAGNDMVESWIENPFTNFGFIIDGTNSDGMGIDSCDHNDVTKRPTLKISVTDDTVYTEYFQQGKWPTPIYDGYEDSWIEEKWGTKNYGTDFELKMDGDSPRRTLMKWDMALPDTIEVTGVRIRYHVLNRSHEKQYRLYEMKRNWSQGTVTWKEFVAGSAWEEDGADDEDDYDGDGMVDRGMVELGRVTGVSMGFEEIELNDKGVAVVQSWISGDSDNYGFIVLGIAEDGVTIDSGEWFEVDKRPMLIVTYRQ